MNYKPFIFFVLAVGLIAFFLGYAAKKTVDATETSIEVAELKAYILERDSVLTVLTAEKALLEAKHDTLLSQLKKRKKLKAFIEKDIPMPKAEKVPLEKDIYDFLKIVREEE